MSEWAASDIESYLYEKQLRDLQAVSEGRAIRCPVCSMVSYNPNDIREKYCGKCRWWTSDPELAPNRPRA